MNSRRLAATILNLVVVAVFAAAVERWWGWGRLLTPWRQIERPILALAVLGMLASYGLRALRIYIAETGIPRGRYLACLRLILINNALNLILPARSGEASFPILMQRWFGIDPARATGTLVWLRLLDLQVLATIAAACAATGWLAPASALSALAWLAAGLAACAPLLLFLLRRPLAAKLAGHDGHIAGLALRALGGLPERRSGLLFDLGLTWAAWSVKLLALAWVLSRLAGIGAVAGLLGAIGGDLSTVLPVHAPGGFGTYEAGVLALLATVAAPSGALLAAAVNLHLLLLTTALLAGAAAWLPGTPGQPGPAPADARL
ncbi:MAG: lysylphosphatidylglycerol synthase domain-containing protein [Nevskia sp.]